MKLKPNDFRGTPNGSRQGRDYGDQDGPTGLVILEPLPFLHGKPWNEVALGYVHALRPSTLRVTDGGNQMDYEPWRVTVNLKNDNCTIDYIEQEVDVLLPDDVEDGGDLDLRSGRERR